MKAVFIGVHLLSVLRKTKYYYGAIAHFVQFRNSPLVSNNKKIIIDLTYKVTEIIFKFLYMHKLNVKFHAEIFLMFSELNYTKLYLFIIFIYYHLCSTIEINGWTYLKKKKKSGSILPYFLFYKI